MTADALPARLVWTALAAERWARRAREATARRVRPTRVVSLLLRSPAGHDLPCRLHLPEGPGPFPAVFLCPGGLDGADGVEGLSPVVTAPRLARAGFAALAWSPSGRNGAPGPEDRNGPLHQDEATAALRGLLARPEVDPDRVGVLSISFGAALAAGLLTRSPDLADRVRVWIDWEGPPSREWFQSHRLRYQTDDDAWWRPREARRAVAAVRCPYWRMQSAWDHVHGADRGLGEEMVDAALGGASPDVRFNGRPAGERPRGFAPVSVDRQGDLLVAWLGEALATRAAG